MSDAQQPAASHTTAAPAAALAATSTPTATTSAANASEPATPDAAELARQKREARKARILAKGSDRLARITNTGRGEGASAYLTPSTPLGPSRPSSAISSSSSPATSVTARGDEDPIEVDVSTLPTIASDEVRRGEAAAGNPFADMGMSAGANHPGGGMPANPMEALIAMMQGQGGPSGGTEGLFGAMGADGAQGAPNLEGLPPQLAAMLQGMPGFGGAASGSASGAGGAQAPLTALRTKTWTERLFDLLQAALVAVLAVYFARNSVFNTDPTLLSTDPIATATASLSSTSSLQRWARLGYDAPSYSDWTSPLLSSSWSSGGGGSGAALPLFWLFITLEVALQAMRIVLFSSKAPQQPASMLGMLASLVPIPNLQTYISLAAKYVGLANAFVNDLAIVVFVFGLSVLWAGWKVGDNQGAVWVRDEL
ncbi:hypothetical protein ACQY0O_004780 [Thecaphora frezii]